MKIDDSKIVSRIPEYLVNYNSENLTSTELLESLNPTTVNLSSSLLDKLLEGLLKFNDWTEFDEYSKEFKLDELFSEISEKFSLTQPELLKGFFKFKGTITDLKYILNVSGYDLNIYESAYYLDNNFIDILNRTSYGGVFQKLLESNYTEGDFNKILDNLYVKYVDNRIPSQLLDNLREYLVVNHDQVISAEEFFSRLGYTPNEDELYYITDAIDSWLSLRYVNYDEYDCYISTDIYVDMDSPNFDGVKVSKLRSLINNILTTRLLICTLLKSIEIYLKMMDKIILDITEDGNLLISKSVKDIITTIDISEEYFFDLGISFTDHIITRINCYKVVNELPENLFVNNNSPYQVGLELFIPGIHYNYTTTPHLADNIDPINLPGKCLFVNNIYPHLANNLNPLAVPGDMRRGIYSFIHDYELTKTVIDEVDLPYEDQEFELSTKVVDEVNGIRYLVDNNQPYFSKNNNPYKVPGELKICYDSHRSEFNIGSTDNYVVHNYKLVVDNNDPIIVDNIETLAVPGVDFVVDNIHPLLLDHSIRIPGTELGVISKFKFDINKSLVDSIDNPSELVSTEISSNYYDSVDGIIKINNNRIYLIDNSEYRMVPGESQLAFDSLKLESNYKIFDKLNLIGDVVDNNNPIDYQNYQVIGCSRLEDNFDSLIYNKSFTDELNPTKDNSELDLKFTSNSQLSDLGLLVNNNDPIIMNNNRTLPGEYQIIYSSTQLELSTNIIDNIFSTQYYVDNINPLGVGDLEFFIPGVETRMNDNEFIIERKLAGTNQWITI